MDRYAEGSIAGIDLVDEGDEPVRLLIEGGNVFEMDLTGNTLSAADGTPYTQLVDVGGKSKTFTLRMEYCPLSLYLAIRAEVATIVEGGADFNVTVTNAVQTINRSCRPNFPDWLTFGEQQGGILKNVAINLIATS